MANVTVSITFLTILKSKYIKYKIGPKSNDVVLKIYRHIKSILALAKLKLKTLHSTWPLQSPIFMTVASMLLRIYEASSVETTTRRKDNTGLLWIIIRALALIFEMSTMKSSHLHVVLSVEFATMTPPMRNQCKFWAFELKQNFRVKKLL